jgi:asparagine N-glycosylation enzyme membrane subunit Stt3
MMLTRERGIPSVGEVFLFALGAVAAFVLLGGVVKVARGNPFEPPYGVLRLTGMIHLLAVGAALGLATLIALIPSGAVWPFGAFVATTTYLSVATIELMLTSSRRSAKSPRAS